MKAHRGGEFKGDPEALGQEREVSDPCPTESWGKIVQGTVSTARNESVDRLNQLS